MPGAAASRCRGRSASTGRRAARPSASSAAGCRSTGTARAASIVRELDIPAASVATTWLAGPVPAVPGTYLLVATIERTTGDGAASVLGRPVAITVDVTVAPLVPDAARPARRSRCRSCPPGSRRRSSRRRSSRRPAADPRPSRTCRRRLRRRGYGLHRPVALVCGRCAGAMRRGAGASSRRRAREDIDDDGARCDDDHGPGGAARDAAQGGRPPPRGAPDQRAAGGRRRGADRRCRLRGGPARQGAGPRRGSAGDARPAPRRVRADPAAPGEGRGAHGRRGHDGAGDHDRRLALGAPGCVRS